MFHRCSQLKKIIFCNHTIEYIRSDGRNLLSVSTLHESNILRSCHHCCNALFHRIGMKLGENKKEKYLKLYEFHDWVLIYESPQRSRQLILTSIQMSRICLASCGSIWSRLIMSQRFLLLGMDHPERDDIWRAHWGSSWGKTRCANDFSAIFHVCFIDC